MTLSFSRGRALAATAFLLALGFGWTSGRSAPCVAAYVKYRDSPVCLDRFESHATEKSSFIRGAWYDAPNRYFLIDLEGTLYRYCRFPRRVWEEFKRTASYGQYYNAQINGSYDCRLGGIPSYAN